MFARVLIKWYDSLIGLIASEFSGDVLRPEPRACCQKTLGECQHMCRKCRASIYCFPVVPSRTSPCSPFPCFTPFLGKLVLVLLYSRQWQSCPSLPCPALVGGMSLCWPLSWSRLCKATEVAMGSYCLHWRRVPRCGTVTSAHAANPLVINSGGDYAWASAV